MNSPIIQLLVLAAIAIFLILRLRSVLGTRDGFEKPPLPRPESSATGRPRLEVVETGPDRDITDHVGDGTDSAHALAAMKRVDPSFGVGEFLAGARGAYEMILMGFEKGELSQIRPFISDEVYDAFAAVVAQREKDGIKVEANFVGVGETAIQHAEFDPETNEGEVTVRFTAEMTYLVRDRAGDIIEGNATSIRKQRDVWTFARRMNSADPNWELVATGD